VAAGYRHSVALRSDGTVVAAGDNRFGQCHVGDWRDIRFPEPRVRTIVPAR
jgi:alpha-tubulin suppressor-like RCC1 family protein